MAILVNLSVASFVQHRYARSVRKSCYIALQSGLRSYAKASFVTHPFQHPYVYCTVFSFHCTGVSCVTLTSRRRSFSTHNDITPYPYGLSQQSTIISIIFACWLLYTRSAQIWTNILHEIYDIMCKNFIFNWFDTQIGYIPNLDLHFVHFQYF